MDGLAEMKIAEAGDTHLHVTCLRPARSFGTGDVGQSHLNPAHRSWASCVSCVTAANDQAFDGVREMLKSEVI